MKEFEAIAKEHVRQNCRELLNKPKLSEEGMDLLWNPMFRYPLKEVGGCKEPDYDRAPSMKVKVGLGRQNGMRSWRCMTCKRNFCSLT